MRWLAGSLARRPRGAPARAHRGGGARIAPILPPRETRGAYYCDDRVVLNGMLLRHATGCAWRDLPERYEPWPTVASRQRRWIREGLWDRTFAALQRELAATTARPARSRRASEIQIRWIGAGAQLGRG